MRDVQHVPFLLTHVGILLISLALCADAVIGNVQEKAMKSYNSTNSEVVSFKQIYEHAYMQIMVSMSQYVKCGVSPLITRIIRKMCASASRKHGQCSCFLLLY
jgi:hypothetical protein